MTVCLRSAVSTRVSFRFETRREGLGSRPAGMSSSGVAEAAVVRTAGTRWQDRRRCPRDEGASRPAAYASDDGSSPCRAWCPVSPEVADSIKPHHMRSGAVHAEWCEHERSLNAAFASVCTFAWAERRCHGHLVQLGGRRPKTGERHEHLRAARHQPPYPAGSGIRVHDGGRHDLACGGGRNARPRGHRADRGLVFG